MDSYEKFVESVLANWGAWQQAANLSHRTITERCACIRHMLSLAQCGPFDITPEVIMAYTTRPGVGRSSRATYHAHIRAYSHWLTRTGQRSDDPTVQTPTPKRSKGQPRPVLCTALREMLAVVNRRRTRMMILLAAYEGLRVHEIAKIRGEDVDLESGVLFVSGKGGRQAYLPLHPEVAALARSGRFPAAGWWFPAYGKAGAIQGAAVSKAIHDTMARAHVNGTPHQLRHWYGTTLVRNGTDLRTVQELMRHASLATTQIYTQVSDLSQREAVHGLQILIDPPSPRTQHEPEFQHFRRLHTRPARYRRAS